MAVFTTKGIPHTSVLAIVLVGVMAARADAQASGEDRPSEPLPRQPYRIRLKLAFERHPFFTEARRNVVQHLAAAHAGRIVGPAWQLDVEEARDGSELCTFADLEQLGDEALRQRASGYDKLFVVGMSYRDGQLALCGREHDTSTGHTGPVFTYVTGTPAALTHGLLQVCLRMFSPLAQVDSSESRSVSMTLKGGELALADPELSWAPPGRAFSAFRRFFRRDRESPEVVPVPWTFVEVDEARGASLSAAVRSRLRRPFTRRTDRPGDIVALGLWSTGRPTRVRFVDDEDKTPLFGYTAVIQPTRAAADAVTVDTDRSGTVVVPALSDGLSFLLLKQGTRRVAFLYVVPGQQAELTVPTVAQESRLALSSELTSIEAEFVDLAARRAVIVTQIERHLADDEVAPASALLETLRALPSQQQMERRVSSFVTGAQEQIGGNLPSDLQERVDQLREQIRQHLNPARIGAVARRVRDHQAAAPARKRPGTQSPDTAS